MSRNGSGVYSLPAGNPVVTGSAISSTWANNTLSDIASALTGSVSADGQTSLTGNLNFGTNKATNMGNPTLAQDGVTLNYLQTFVQSLYPVGSIYTSTVATNPNTLFGFGTWSAFGAGRVMIGQDGSTWVAGATGGSADATLPSHTHTASSSSTATVTDPGHSHSYGLTNGATTLIGQGNGGGEASGGFTGGATITAIGTGTNSAVTGISVGVSTTTTVTSAGSSPTNANLQPYVVVYMWNRTA
jgi:hypothetical protein